MRIILLGPPACGKGTQAAILKREFDIQHIATGDMLRKTVRVGSSIGREIEGYISSGLLVPDDLIIQMVFSRLQRIENQRGFLLDGFPRTPAQAEALDWTMRQDSNEIDAVICIEVPDQEVISRVSGRLTDPETGAVYHEKTLPPPSGILERCIRRSDDTEEKMITRLCKYHAESEPLKEYYQDRGILNIVDGTLTLEKVSSEIFATLRLNV